MYSIQLMDLLVKVSAALGDPPLWVYLVITGFTCAVWVPIFLHIRGERRAFRSWLWWEWNDDLWLYRQTPLQWLDQQKRMRRHRWYWSRKVNKDPSSKSEWVV